MAARETVHRQVDPKGRVCLPPGFADCVVLIEVRDENTLVVRRAVVAPVDDLAAVLSRPPEPGNRIVATGADVALVAGALADPPPPNAVLKKLMRAKRPRKRKAP